MDDAASAPPLPDRLSVDPRSPHHVAAVFEHGVGIRLNGKERFDVEEYCLSEGWVKVPAGKTLDRKGRPLLITLKGKVESTAVVQRALHAAQGVAGVREVENRLVSADSAGQR